MRLFFGLLLVVLHDRARAEVARTRQQPALHLAKHLQALDQPHMMLGVGVKDGLNANSAHFLVLPSGQGGEDGRFGLRHDLEQACTVHVLKGRRVVVAYCQIARRLHQEIVGDTRVAQVVADSADHKCELLQPRHQLAVLAALMQQHEKDVRHVHSMTPGVVLRSLGVSRRHLPDEGVELLNVSTLQLPLGVAQNDGADGTALRHPKGPRVEVPRMHC
mmetsp:Transcript_6292/g.14903  ORF Transcript_6292/g.14903 Transcript_6292/m.14903 type:complete len:218 (-) Transcript_6292:635-1288(-)